LTEEGDRPNPNTALLSAILMFGTFFIAYFLRIFRNSKFLGRNVSTTILTLFGNWNVGNKIETKDQKDPTLEHHKHFFR